MKTYISKNAELINAAGFSISSATVPTKLYHETAEGATIDIGGLRVTGNTLYSVERGTRVFTEIKEGDQVYLYTAD